MFTSFTKDAVAKSLADWSPDRAVRVRAMTENIASCSRARHFTLTVSLCPPRSINGSGELLGQLDIMLGVTRDGLTTHLEGIAILSAASCYRNQS